MNLSDHGFCYLHGQINRAIKDPIGYDYVHTYQLSILALQHCLFPGNDRQSIRSIEKLVPRSSFSNFGSTFRLSGRLKSGHPKHMTTEVRDLVQSFVFGHDIRHDGRTDFDRHLVRKYSPISTSLLIGFF